jgi:hypothetical protein
VEVIPVRTPAREAVRHIGDDPGFACFSAFFAETEHQKNRLRLHIFLLIRHL